ncbi:histone H1.3-like [Daphnia carinata]|uniref:histone H1.3-like n=1 Tax=Daphnia carinata TaxID=120202 RepID=UPI002580DE1D|nr:histone H1.3-like [Daphnia carinata]
MKFQVLSMLAVVILMLSLALAKPMPAKSSPDAGIEAQRRLQQQIEKEFGEEEWFEGLNGFINKFVQQEEALKSLSKSTTSPGSKTVPPSHAVTSKAKKPEAPQATTKKTMSKPEKETAPKADKSVTAKEAKTVPPKAAKPTSPLPVKSNAKRTGA